MTREKLLGDTSHELHIYRYNNGIYLLTPDQVKKKNVLGFPIKHTIQSLFNLPFSIYFLDHESRLRNANPINLEVCGYDSLKQGLGKTAFEVAKNKFSLELMENDKMVIRHNQMHFFDESMLLDDNTLYGGCSIKIPCYNNHGQIIGVLGFSIVNGIHSMATSLAIIQRIGLLSTQKYSCDFLPKNCINNVSFTAREIMVLKNVIKGNSARAIGNILYISQRTVETHFQNIKIKLGVRTKAEVIEKILNEKLL